MSRFTGAKDPMMVTMVVMMMMVISSSGLLSAQDNATLEVVYPPASINVSRGSAVLLSCETRYRFEQCRFLHAAWQRADPRPAQLTQPGKYLTTVNETQHGAHWRRRHVVTKIVEVAAEDGGRFQCVAQCSGETAMGHFITVTVRG